jgi:hypothetical protein
MYPIYSYGSPRFSLGNLSVHFSTRFPAGLITFQPQEEHYETLSGGTVTVFKGYRALVQLKLYNMLAQDYQDHLTLLNIINTSRSLDKPILLQPRFSTGVTVSLWVKPQGDVKYEEITNLNAGQSIDLEFFTPELLSELPLVVNLPSFLLLDATSYLLLSAAGDRLIIPHTNFNYIDVTTEESYA